MKVNKGIWGLGLLLILSLIGGIYYCMQGTSLDYKKLMNEIEERTYVGTEINQELYQAVLEKIELKESNGEKILPIEQFFLGYRAYYSEEYEKAYNYYMPISRVEISNNDNLANVLMNAQLNRICASLGKGEEAVELTYYWFNYYEDHLFKKHMSVIHTLVGQLLSVNDGENIVIDLYERILADEDSQSYELLSYLKQGLQTMYAGKGNYGRALEIGMEELAKAEDAGNSEIIVVQKYAIGSIYAEMQNFEYAQDWLAQCFKIPTSGSEKIAYYKVSSAINYVNCVAMTNKYDGIKEAVKVYDESFNILEERYRPDVEANFALAMANYYHSIGELDQAVERLEFANSIMNPESSTEDYKTDFLTVYGECYMALGEYDKAISALDEVLKYEYVLNSESVAKTLLEYYIRIGDTENIKKYSDQIQEIHNKIQKNINVSYADYAAQKYQYETALHEMNEKKLKNYMTIFVISIVGLIIISLLYFRLRVIRRLNCLDGLTQIFNRGHFNKRYETFKKHGKEFYLVMFDIDNFKKLNDTYGHVYGDYVIKNIAQITKKTVGKAGQVFRYGGEEFAVIFEGNHQEQIIAQVEEIRRAVEVFEWDMSCHVTISVGVSYSEGHEKDVINEADKWLYEAKRSGKNRVCYQH